MATTFKKVTNNGQSTLNADVTTTVQTTIQINPSHTSRFPASGSFWVRVYNNSNPASATVSELMLVTGVSSNTFTVTRNADGLGASTFTTGQAVRLNIMAEHVSDLNTAVNALENTSVTTTSVANLTNKSLEDSTTTIYDNLDNTKKIAFQVSGLTTATTRTLTAPDADITLVGSSTLGNTGNENFTYYGMARQAIINGNFDVWQRATTNTYSGGTAFGPSLFADRWNVYHDNGASGTIPTIVTSRQTLTAGDIPNSYYFYRCNVNGAGSGMGTAQQGLMAYQKIEYGTRFLCGASKQVTVSFYARTSIVGTKKIGINLTQNYGSGGSPSSQEIIAGQTQVLSSTWTRYSFTFTTNTLVGKTFGSNNDDHLILNFWAAWGSSTGTTQGLGSAETYVGSGNIDIAQVQVNAGSVSLPFQPRASQDELTLCRRYCRVITTSTAIEVVGLGSPSSTSGGTMIVGLETPSTMRTTPTLTATASDWSVTDGTTTTALTSLSISPISANTALVLAFGVSGTPLTQFRQMFLVAPTAPKTMIFSSEL